MLICLFYIFDRNVPFLHHVNMHRYSNAYYSNGQNRTGRVMSKYSFRQTAVPGRDVTKRGRRM